MAVSLAYLLVPPVGLVPMWVPKLLLYGSVSASAVACLLVGVRRYRPDNAAPWRLLAAGQLIYLAADLTFYTLHDIVHRASYPGLADVLYLGHYPLVLLGLLALVRSRTPGSDRASLLDASIIATSLGVLSLVFLIEPTVHQSAAPLTRVVSSAYPVMDMLVLALAARLLVGGGIRPPAFYLLTGSLLLLLATDMSYTFLQLKGLYETNSLSGKLLDAGWLGVYLLLGAAALHPSMRLLTEPDHRAVARAGAGRMAFLACAALLAPVLVIVQSQRHDIAASHLDLTVTVAGCGVLVALVMVRMLGLVRQVERAAAQLRQRGSQLQASVTAHQRAETQLRGALEREHATLEHEHTALQREQAAAEHLRELDRLKGTFLQAVSHDLRTPLASILGMALTLQRGRGVLPDAEVTDLLGRLVANARKLDRIVADLLDLDRLASGAIQPRRQATDLAALLRRVVDGLDVLQGRQVEIDAGPRSVPPVPVDPAKVERIVENLLANTVRHTPPEARVWVRVQAQAHAHGDGVVIVVEDDGPGVPPQLRETIFHPFSRGPSVSDHAPGSGVGLAVVARLAELHGGRAWVEDRPGGGAAFHVLLPQSAQLQPEPPPDHGD